MKINEFFADCHTDFPTKDFICGVEFEIENVKSLGEIHALLDDNLIVEDDPSLRNNGREFKTPPSTFTDTLNWFERLHSTIVLGPEPYTDRTSTHVHVNVSHMTLPQVRELVLTYALVEPLFFNFVGEERLNNIYCVPLNYTYLPNRYKLSLPELVQIWHKYTAFNIIPLTTLGTVEFRHLFGTGDKAVFTKWLTALKELYDFVNDQPGLSIITLMQNHSAVELAKKIVPTLCANITNSKLSAMLEDSALDVKLSVGGLK